MTRIGTIFRTSCPLRPRAIALGTRGIPARWVGSARPARQRCRLATARERAETKRESKHPFTDRRKPAAHGGTRGWSGAGTCRSDDEGAAVPERVDAELRHPRTSRPSVLGFRILGWVNTRKPSEVSVRSQSNASGGGSVEVRRNRSPASIQTNSIPPRARISFFASEVASICISCIGTGGRVHSRARSALPKASRISVSSSISVGPPTSSSLGAIRL